jgi:hypothetical protein
MARQSGRNPVKLPRRQIRRQDLDNKTAMVLAILIIGLFVVDAYVLHWDLPLFLMTKLSQLIDHLAFWR